MFLVCLWMSFHITTKETEKVGAVYVQNKMHMKAYLEWKTYIKQLLCGILHKNKEVGEDSERQQILN